MEGRKILLRSKAAAFSSVPWAHQSAAALQGRRVPLSALGADALVLKVEERQDAGRSKAAAFRSAPWAPTQSSSRSRIAKVLLRSKAAALRSAPWAPTQLSLRWRDVKILLRSKAAAFRSAPWAHQSAAALQGRRVPLSALGGRRSCT